MELTEHRSTLERLHRSELAARDIKILHLSERVVEVEADNRRLRIALQVLTGRPVPGPNGPGPPAPEGYEPGVEQERT
jgi:hypothetical protein